ncbi:hypothetical protein LSH36_259g00015 [Paralvinella palmiformis]|uniref:Uncharacterized protein n=1 Tax=Paralvinella palmiformis TaxID=53620 RepID=A0AAD9N441_9ANNE|nr:hypothetical protein LSH36_259g00015 [Paralvinella palmiformis]
METATTPSSMNTTTERYVVFKTAPVMRNIIFTIGGVGLVGNIFVVIVILSGTKMRKQLTNTYIINQKTLRPIGLGDPEVKSCKDADTMGNARKDILKTLAIVAFCFAFCWSWNQTYFLMFNLGSELVDFTSPFYNFTVVMVFLN